MGGPKNIYHISLDEKFATTAYVQFEGAYPKHNLFYIVVKNAETPIIHATEKAFIKITRADLLQLVHQIEIFDLVVFHSLPSVFYKFLNTLDKRIVTLWLCYGFEVYNDPCLFKNQALFGTFTLPHIKTENTRCPSKLKLNLRKIIRAIYPNLPFLPLELKYLAFNRINYIGTSFKEEYEHILTLTGINKPLFKYWQYPLELIVDFDSTIEGERRHILVGNSATSTNNHLDVFERIKNLNYEDFEAITVPLNYGRDDLTAKVETVGAAYFKNKFDPLLNFLELKVYNGILKQCGIAIFYNKRQQAIGTTIALLWFGAKVYLSNKNPFYQFLKRKNVIIFNVEFDLAKANTLTVLNNCDIEHNREILKSFLSEKMTRAELENQLKLIMSK